MEVNTLSRLPEGHEGEIEFICNKSSFRRHLFELGFLPGTKVYCIRHNEMLELITVRLRGAVLFIRTCDAELIKIK